MKKRKLEFRPDGIIVTMPQSFMEEYKWSNFIKAMDAMNEESDEPMLWFRVVRNLPSIQPQYCYIVVGGRIRFRTNILEYRRNTDISFPRPDGTEVFFNNCNLIVLCGPAVRPSEKLPMKGFQGFRYTEKLF